MSQMCHRCDWIVARACQSDTEAEGCKYRECRVPLHDQPTWTIVITEKKNGSGFVYQTVGPGVGMSGYEPTRESLGRIIALTIEGYLPATRATKKG